MIKYVRMAIEGLPSLLVRMPRTNKYLKHLDQYPIEERYEFVHQLAVKLCKRAFRCQFYITGQENLKLAKGQSLIVANHNSNLDPISFLAFSDRPISFLGKAQIRKFPFFGKMLASIDGSFIDREDLRSEIKVFRQINDLLEKEKSLSYVVFPEGTRSKGPDFEMIPFKGGSFKIATRLDLPIIPVATYLNERIQNQHYHYHRYPIQVAYLKPILPEEYQNMSTGEIAALAQSRIQEALTQLKANDLHCIMDCNHYSEKKASKVQLCRYDKNKKN